MWWLISSAPDFWGRGPGFEFGISHNESDALQDHCVIMYRKTQGREWETYPLRQEHGLKQNLKHAVDIPFQKPRAFFVGYMYNCTSFVQGEKKIKNQTNALTKRG